MSQSTDITLNSANRTSGTNSAPLFVLDQNIKLGGDMSVVKLVIPGTWYNVSATELGNATIDFEDDVATQYQAIIPDGGYTPTTLAAAAQTAMLAQLANMTVAYNADSFRLVFANGATDFRVFATSAAAGVLGITTTPGAAAASQLADQTVNVSRGGFFLHSDRLNNRQSRGHLVDTGFDRRVVMWREEPEVGVRAVWDQKLDSRSTFAVGDSQMTSIDISLVDQAGRPVDLHGHPWWVTLRTRTFDR